MKQLIILPPTDTHLYNWLCISPALSLHKLFFFFLQNYIQDVSAIFHLNFSRNNIASFHDSKRSFIAYFRCQNSPPFYN